MKYKIYFLSWFVALITPFVFVYAAFRQYGIYCINVAEEVLGYESDGQ